jgi:hypothetical protein
MPVTRFIYLSFQGAATVFVDQLNTYLTAGYTLLLGNIGFEKTSSPILREALLESSNYPYATGVTLIKNY